VASVVCKRSGCGLTLKGEREMSGATPRGRAAGVTRTHRSTDKVRHALHFQFTERRVWERARRERKDRSGDTLRLGIPALLASVPRARSSPAAMRCDTERITCRACSQLSMRVHNRQKWKCSRLLSSRSMRICWQGARGEQAENVKSTSIGVSYISSWLGFQFQKPRPKLGDPAPLAIGRDGRVRCSAWFRHQCKTFLETTLCPCSLMITNSRSSTRTIGSGGIFRGGDTSPSPLVVIVHTTALFITTNVPPHCAARRRWPEVSYMLF
jgi:hypothetical protein